MRPQRASATVDWTSITYLAPWAARNGTTRPRSPVSAAVANASRNWFASSRSSALMSRDETSRARQASSPGLGPSRHWQPRPSIHLGESIRVRTRSPSDARGLRRGESRAVRREYLGAGMVVFTVAYGVLVYWAATSGTALAWTALVIVSVGLAVILSIVVSRRARRLSRSLIELAASPGDGVYRVLIVVDAAATSASLRQALQELPGATAGQPTEALVVAPTLSSRLDRWTGDESAYDDAATRLHEIITVLDALGIEARGHIGSHDPLVAIEEGLREFAADWIVFVTRSDDRSNWLESGVLADTTDRTDLPVSHIVVDDAVLG